MPSVFKVGAIQLRLALPGGGCAAATVMEKAGNAADENPSLTLITIPEYVPTPVAVPLNRPVAMLKVAHAGMFVIENDSVLPDGSVVVGVNEYDVPAVTLAGGVPDMVGGGAETLTVTDWLALPPGPLQLSA